MIEKREKLMLYRTNITNIGDPFVVSDGEKYIMYATTFDAKGFRYYTSENLVDWEDGGVAIDLSDSKDRKMENM